MERYTSAFFGNSTVRCALDQSCICSVDRMMLGNLLYPMVPTVRPGVPDRFGSPNAHNINNNNSNNNNNINNDK